MRLRLLACDLRRWSLRAGGLGFLEPSLQGRASGFHSCAEVSSSCQLVNREAPDIKLVAELNANITNGFEHLLNAGLQSQEVGMGLRFFGCLLHFDSSGKNLRVCDAELDGLRDKRERLVSHGGEGLALFRGQCRTDRQLALDLREMTLRGFQRGGVVGR